MKKRIFLAFVLVMAFCMLVGCNKSNSTTATQNRSTGGGNDTQSSSNQPTPATDTVAGFLSQFGLTEVDIKPEGAPNGTHAVDVRKKTKGRVSWNVNNPTTEQKTQWVQKVIEETKTLATDGKLYVDSNFSSEFVLSSIEETVTWVYKYNNSYIIIKCELLYGGVFDLNIDQG